MKKLIIGSVIALASILTPQILQAQGTMYISNVGLSSAGSHAVGNDSWLAAGFSTGTNANGYLLDSVQLGIADATGNPSNFTAMIYSAIVSAGINPGSSIEILSGSANPSTAGIYTYTDASNLMLSPNTDYFIVLTAGTAVASGAYEWSYAGTYSYNLNGGWVAPLGLSAVDNYQSSDGLHWNFIGGPSQFSITATPVPEPSTLGLLCLGGLLFILYRRKAKVVL